MVVFVPSEEMAAFSKRGQVPGMAPVGVVMGYSSPASRRKSWSQSSPPMSPLERTTFSSLSTRAPASDQ